MLWFTFHFRFDKEGLKWSLTYLKQTKSRDSFSSSPVVFLVNFFIIFLFIFTVSSDSSVSSGISLFQVIIKITKDFSKIVSPFLSCPQNISASLKLIVSYIRLDSLEFIFWKSYFEIDADNFHPKKSDVKFKFSPKERWMTLLLVYFHTKL